MRAVARRLSDPRYLLPLDTHDVVDHGVQKRQLLLGHVLEVDSFSEECVEAGLEVLLGILCEVDDFADFGRCEDRSEVQPECLRGLGGCDDLGEARLGSVFVGGHEVHGERELRVVHEDPQVVLDELHGRLGAGFVNLDGDRGRLLLHFAVNEHDVAIGLPERTRDHLLEDDADNTGLSEESGGRSDFDNNGIQHDEGDLST